MLMSKQRLILAHLLKVHYFVGKHINSKFIVKYVFLAILLCPLLSSSQNFWEKINIPSGYTFSSVAVGDNGTIYLGSHKTNDTGWVFMSENGGATWEKIGLKNYSIYSLELNQEGNLLVGTNTRIFLYDFEEQSWDEKHFSLTNIISMVGFENDFFAGGSTFNRSYDDGYTWEETTDMGQDGIYSIVAQSVDTIYIGTINFLGGGGVFQTVNGGDSWQNIGMEDWWIASIGRNSTGDLFAGCLGHRIYSLSGFYRLTSGSDTWDTLSYWPRIKAIVITGEDVIYCGYWTTDENGGGVMHSSDNGETWTTDTAGMGNVGISVLLLDNDETLYALSSTFPPSKLFRSVKPVSVNQPISSIKKYNSFCSPNPFNSETIIYFENPDRKQLFLTVYSQYGNLIYSRSLSDREIDQEELVFNRNCLQGGIYIYSITGKGYSYTGKFFIIN